MIYQYRCKTCGKSFEKEVNLKEILLLQELGQNTLPNCPKCGSSDTIKTISTTTVVFKGDGFTKSKVGNDYESTDSD